MQRIRPMPSLIEDLQSPDAYPPPRPAAVELRTTHASWVFLTGPEVWKIKRPVNFGFLDFSTLEKRRAICADEVRLNAQLAPGVYLGVEPVVRGPDGHRIGAGDPVEFAVHMVRLPDEDAALPLLRAGRLSVAHLRALAARLGAFYAGLPPLTDEGATAAFARAVTQNFEQLRPFAGTNVSGEALAAMESQQTTALARALPRLHAREAQGFVKECHGDLRLEHVYFPGGRADAVPVCIDALEFNRALRVIDVGLDVAFFAMELLGEGRRDESEDFLAAFAQASNDFALYAPLDLFVGYRALVRAKVACIVAADSGTPAEKRRRKIEEATRLFALAERSSRPVGPAPWLLVVMGLPGTGKSTLAQALGATLHVPVVSSDATRKHLGGVPPTARAPAALYSDDFSQRTLQQLLRSADDVLGSGRGVILDGTFRKAADRAAVRRLAATAGCPLLFVQTICDEAIVRERLRVRQQSASVSDADAAVFETLRQQFEPPVELPAAEYLIVDSARPAPEPVAQVEARLLRVLPREMFFDLAHR